MEMVIPLSLGYLFAKERDHDTGVSGWRDRLLRWGTPEASRPLLIYFGGLIMVAALLLTGSRAGLLSFLGSMLLFRSSYRFGGFAESGGGGFSPFLSC